MQIVRYRSLGETSWGLLEEDDGCIRHIAGSFSAWASRITNGEGAYALPITGRKVALRDAQLLAPVEAGRSIWHLDGSSSLFVDAETLPRHRRSDVAAALVGAPLEGRRNPLRSIFGYTVAYITARADSEATKVTLGTRVVGRAAVGDNEFGMCAALTAVFGFRTGRTGSTSLGRRLEELNGQLQLRTGDVVLFPVQFAANSLDAPAVVETVGEHLLINTG